MMSKINSLVIEGEVIENYENSIILAYERNTRDTHYVYHFNVEYNYNLMNLMVGDQIRIVGKLQQNTLNDKVVIVAQNIEIVNRVVRRSTIPNE